MDDVTSKTGDAGPSSERVMHRMQLQFSVEQFYYAEAAALDERRFEDWLELFASDARYWMPVRRTCMSKDLDREFSAPGAVAYFDDTKQMLANRIRKLRSGSSWSEDPPSRTRHLVTNIRILDESESALNVASNFHLYRSRFDSEEDSWIGRRHDVLERESDSFRIRDRKIYLDQTVILSTNLSSFF